MIARAHPICAQVRPLGHGRHPSSRDATGSTVGLYGREGMFGTLRPMDAHSPSDRLDVFAIASSDRMSWRTSTEMSRCRLCAAIRSCENPPSRLTADALESCASDVFFRSAGVVPHEVSSHDAWEEGVGCDPVVPQVPGAVRCHH